MKYIYFILIISLIITIIYLLIQLKEFRKKTETLPYKLEELGYGINASKEKLEYIEYTRKRSLLAEVLLTYKIFKDYKKERKHKPQENKILALFYSCLKNNPTNYKNIPTKLQK